MKAIFSNFSRRANLGAAQDPSEAAYKSKSANGPSTSSASHPRATFSSFHTPSGGIGDAPASEKTPSNHLASSNTSTYKFSSSSRATSSHQRKRTAHDNATASSSTHPPSSYRELSSQTSGAHAVTRGLVKKLSIASRRRSSYSSLHAPTHEHHLAATSATHAGSHSNQPMHSKEAQPSIPTFSQTSGQFSGSSIKMAAVANPDTSVMTSTQLAARLNELAVANADGLLTEDEYRTLRQAVFDQMLTTDSQAMAIPTDHARAGLGLPSRNHSPNAARTDPTPSANHFLSATPLNGRARHSASSLVNGDQPTPSIHSGRSGKSSNFQSVTQLFKSSPSKPRSMNHQGSRDSHSSHERATSTRRDSEGMSSQLSSGDTHSQRAFSFRTHQSSAAKSSRMSALGRLRASSHARREQADVTSRQLEEAFSAERTARSLRSVSLYDAGSVELASLRATAYDKSFTSLRAEMAPMTMFGAEYAHKSSSEIQAEIGVVLAEGNRMLATFVTLQEALLARHNSLDALTVKSVVDTVQEMNPLACVNELVPSEAMLHSISSSSLACRAALAPRGTANRPLASDSADAVVAAEIASLQAKLSTIYAQKAAVVKRYQDRLSFLASKLRSAAIREGLK